MSKMSGNESVHVMGLLQALIDDFSFRWKRSIMPLAIGWYDVVLMRLHPNSSISRCHSADSN